MMPAVTARAIVTRLWDGQPQNDALIPDWRQRLDASKSGSYAAKTAKAPSTPPTYVYVVLKQRMLWARLSHILWILCLLDRASLRHLKNKIPTWCHLLFYFTSHVLNMFRTLIYPSSGACDYSVELPHCSWFDVCWSFGVVRLEWYLCCRLKPATRIPLQPNHSETPTHIEPRTMW